MPRIAVPIASRQPNLAGLSILLVGRRFFGDLPNELHLVSEEEERALLRDNDVPTALVLNLDALDLDALQLELNLVLAALYLNGSGTLPAREAWVYSDPPDDVDQTVALPIRAHEHGEFALRAGINEDQLAADYRRIRNAAGRVRRLEVTIEHMVLAQSRSDLSGGLLDLTISLESLIPSQTEVSFRFSNQLARIVADEAVGLSDAVERLGRLYSFRSSHVHGSRGKTYRGERQALQDDWTELERMMKMACSYAVEFHSTRPEREWQAHLNGLMIGSEVRLEPNWGPFS